MHILRLHCACPADSCCRRSSTACEYRIAVKLWLQEGEALEAMYENGGTLATEDGKIGVLAGSTLGGGTRVNWWVCQI